MNKTDPLFSVTAKDCEWSYTRGTGAGGSAPPRPRSLPSRTTWTDQRRGTGADRTAGPAPRGTGGQGRLPATAPTAGRCSDAAIRQPGTSTPPRRPRWGSPPAPA